MPSHTKKPRKNRREAEAAARRQQFLRHASDLFLRKGYRRTSLAEIIAHSGGSRETLAKYFKNKAGLYAAAIEQGTLEFVEHSHLSTLKGTPETVLRRYGEMALRFFLRPASLAGYRDVISEGMHAPEIVAAFHRSGHGRVVQVLASQLRHWQQQGWVSTPDPEGDADFFTHLLRSGLHEHVLLGLRPLPTDAEISEKVANAVRVLLRGIGR